MTETCSILHGALKPPWTAAESAQSWGHLSRTSSRQSRQGASSGAARARRRAAVCCIRLTNAEQPVLGSRRGADCVLCYLNWHSASKNKITYEHSSRKLRLLVPPQQAPPPTCSGSTAPVLVQLLAGARQAGIWREALLCILAGDGCCKPVQAAAQPMGSCAGGGVSAAGCSCGCCLHQRLHSCKGINHAGCGVPTKWQHLAAARRGCNFVQEGASQCYQMYKRCCRVLLLLLWLLLLLLLLLLLWLVRPRLRLW